MSGTRVRCGAVPGSRGVPHLGWFGTWWVVTPAVIILIFPLGFRLTCYYYRNAYYRSWWRSPPACAVPERHQSYSGESRFPLVMQFLHRYFFYAAVVFNVIPPWDAVIAFDWDGRPGMGLGTVVLLVKRCPAVAVHAVVSCLSACGRWADQPFLPPSDPVPVLDGGHQAESASRRVRVGVAGVGGAQRRLRAPGRERRDS